MLKLCHPPSQEPRYAGTSYFFVNHAGRSVDEETPPLRYPGLLVRDCDRVEVARRGIGVINPLAQQRRAVDDVDRELVEDIFVREVAPQRIIRIEPADRLEGERLQPPRLERVMVVEWPLRVDEKAAAHLAGMLVKGRLEGHIAQLAADEPLGRQPFHFGHDLK